MAGLGLVGSAVALALGRDEPFGPRGIVQVGGLHAEDLLRSASTPVLAIDSRDRRRVLLANRVERPEFSCSAFTSGDGGKTWRASRFTLPRAGERCYAPAVGFANGRAYLFLSMLAGPGNHPVRGYLYESRNGGASFGPPRPVLPRSAFQPILAAGESGVVALAALTANEFSSHTNLALGPPPNPISVRVAERGRAFGPLRRVTPQQRRLVGGPALAVGPAGEVYVAYWDYGADVFDYNAFPGNYGGRFQLLLAVSLDGGRTFRHHVVERAVVPARPFLIYLPPLPAIAVDPESGALSVAWEDGRSGSSDILFRSSADRGATWSASRVLFGSPADERTPALAAAPGGRVIALAYQLTSGDRADTVVRVSTDGAETFSAAAAMTPTAFDTRPAPRIPGKRDQVDLGSRLALAAVPGNVMAAWADTRTGSRDTGKVDILVSRLPSDLPAARQLRTASAPSPSGPLQPARRLVGECGRGPLVDSAGSPANVVRSFLSALDRGESRRAYGYLHGRWRLGRPPTAEPHPYDRFARATVPLSCVRPAAVERRGGDAHWQVLDTYSAVRRQGGPTRLLIGSFWVYSGTGRAPWRIMGYWTHELPARRETVVAGWIEATLEAIAVERVNPPRAARALALVSVAMHEAARRVQVRPENAADAAAATVFSYVFPSGPRTFAGAASRGASDIGAAVGRRIVERARADGSDARWQRKLRVGPGVWVSTPPVFARDPLEPAAGTWRTWNLRSGRQFRPAAPPRPGSAAYDQELREVYRVSRTLTDEQRAIAKRWAQGPGTSTPSGHWNQIALRLARARGFSLRRTARLLATLNTAQADASIAAWDAKYAHWSERPVTAVRRKLDPAWSPYLTTPPFPSYVSGHSATSGAASEVLARFFPGRTRALRAQAQEAAVSRLYAGIHFRSDNEAGLELGRRVGEAAFGRTTWLPG